MSHPSTDGEVSAVLRPFAFTPGPPRERYFEELAEIRASGRTLTDAEWADVYRRHDQVMVG